MKTRSLGRGNTCMQAVGLLANLSKCTRLKASRQRTACRSPNGVSTDSSLAPCAIGVMKLKLRPAISMCGGKLTSHICKPAAISTAER